MGVVNTAVSVTTGPAVKLGTARPRRQTLVIWPPASGTLYIGGSTVSSTSYLWKLTSSDTVPFMVNSAFDLDLTPQQEYWGIGSTSQTIAVGEIVK